MSTTVSVEVLCLTANCSLTKRGSFVASMRAACGIAAKHTIATGHQTLARLTQETAYP